MSVKLSQKVSGPVGVALYLWLIGPAAVAVFDILSQCNRAPCFIAGPEPHRTVQYIVGPQNDCAVAVALLYLITRSVQAPSPNSSVMALDAQRVVSKIVDVLKRHPPQSILYCQQIAPDVIGRSCMVLLY